MDAWVLWTVIACVLAVGEVLTTGFFLIFFSAGAVIAGVASLAGAGTAVSWTIFIVASLILLGLLRPIARRHQTTTPSTVTGTAALVGQHAIVLERIANHEGVGCVKIGGEVWTARSLDDALEIPAGEQVEVREIRGATALVSN